MPRLIDLILSKQGHIEPCGWNYAVMSPEEVAANDRGPGFWGTPIAHLQKNPGGFIVLASGLEG
jgi:hypothetical protein